MAKVYELVCLTELNNKHKNDERYLKRLGKKFIVLNEQIDTLKADNPLFLEYVERAGVVKTSNIVEIYREDNLLRVTTENSEYLLRNNPLDK